MGFVPLLIPPTEKDFNKRPQYYWDQLYKWERYSNHFGWLFWIYDKLKEK